jgi:hypothetical protein
VTEPGLLYLHTWLDPEVDDRFSSWCDTHHQEHLAVPGFRRVRRGKLVTSEATDPPRFLTVYDLDEVGVLHGDDYEAYRRASAGLPDDLAPVLRFARSEGTEVGRFGPQGRLEVDDALVEGGPGLLTLFLAAERPAGQSSALLDDIDDVATAVAAADGITCVRRIATANGDHVLLAEVADIAAVDPSTLPRPEAATPDEAWGLYELEHTATP